MIYSKLSTELSIITDLLFHSQFIFLPSKVPNTVHSLILSILLPHSLLPPPAPIPFLQLLSPLLLSYYMYSLTPSPPDIVFIMFPFLVS